MEWEEALLGAWSGEIPPRSAAYYRRKAAQARQIAEGATTPAIKARLLDEAVHCHQLAGDADCVTGEKQKVCDLGHHEERSRGSFR